MLLKKSCLVFLLPFKNYKFGRDTSPTLWYRFHSHDPQRFPYTFIMKFRSPYILKCLAIGMLAAAAVDLQAQTLPITSGLQLWLNADVGITTNASGQITAWADQSGLGNNATQPTVGSAPIIAPASLNGHATVRVTGSQYMEVQNANGIDNLLDDVSILIVVKSTTSPAIVASFPNAPVA